MPKSGSSSKSKTSGQKSSASMSPSSSNQELPPLSAMEALPPLPSPPDTTAQPRLSTLDSALPFPPQLPPLPVPDKGASLAAASNAVSPSTSTPQLLPCLPDEDAAPQLPSSPPPPDLPPVPSDFELPSPSSLAADSTTVSDSVLQPPLAAHSSASAAGHVASAPSQDAVSSQVIYPLFKPRNNHTPLQPIVTVHPQQLSARNSTTEASFSSRAATEEQRNDRSVRLVSPESTSPVSAASLAHDGINGFSGSVTSALQKFKADQNDLVQVIKEKEDSLSQLVATANALVLKERCFAGDLNRIRRERQDQILLIRRLNSEQIRYEEACGNLSAQIASVSDALSLASLNFPLPVVADAVASDVGLQPTEASSSEDWLASVQANLKHFEAQAAVVAQACAELRANYAGASASARALHQLFSARRAHIQQLVVAEAENAERERDTERSLSEIRESISECGQILSAAQSEILSIRSLYIQSSSRISELGALVVAASPPRAPGSAHRVLYDSPSAKSTLGDSQHYFGFRVSATSHADVMPSTMDYLRLPDVSPPPVGPSTQRVVERDDSVFLQNLSRGARDAATLQPVSLSVGSPSSSKKKMGMSSMFRQQPK